MRTLALVAALATWILMVLGGTVSGTGSGLGCGPEWPKCQGYWVPPFTEAQVFIEWIHRLVAALVGPPVVAAAGLTWLRSRDAPDRGLRPLAAGALVLLAAQILLGAITVWLELPAAVSTAHLAIGTALFAALIVMVVSRDGPGTDERSPADRHGPGRRLLGIAAILTYGRMVLGAYVRHSGAGLACPDLIICAPAGMAPVILQFAHRLMAVAVLGAVLAAAWQTRRRAAIPVPRVAAWGALGLVLAQIALGALSVATTLSVPVTTAHLGVALLLLATLIYGARRPALSDAEVAASSRVSRRAGEATS